jgi:hypothetical protein
MLKTFGAAVLVVLALTGCTSTAPTEPAPTSSAASPTPTETPITEPANVTAAFREIADASCAKANAEGVVETTADGAASNILVPKKFAYKEFNAVAVSEDDGFSLIWSTEDFVTCNASVGLAMAEESGGEYPLEVTFDSADGSFSTAFDGGQGFVIETRYIVSNGVIARAFLGPSDNELEMAITYGMPTDAQVEVLTKAVDAFLAED